jgi:hypothetical protein
MSKVLLCAVFSLVVCVGLRDPASAETIRVAVDGSGDYTSLFDALAAAREGDTVSIAAGEYTETEEVNPSGSFAYQSFGLISAPNVTVVGDDRDAVIIGPAVRPPGLKDKGPYGPGTPGGAPGIRFESLTLRNVSAGLHSGDHAISVANCRFLGCNHGINESGAGASSIVDCEFDSNYRGICSFRPAGTRNQVIARCKFIDNTEGVQIQGRASRIDSCEFSGGFAGVVSALGGRATVVDCVFGGGGTTAVWIGNGAIVWLYGSTLRGPSRFLIYLAEGGLIGEGNNLIGPTEESIRLQGPQLVEFEGNHFINGGGLTVYATVSTWDAGTISLANNWWGTTDADQVEAWVHHQADDPDWNGLTVEYLPMAGGPIPTEVKSASRLKSQYQE